MIETIVEAVARLVGNAFVAFTGSARVLVGSDARDLQVKAVGAKIDGGKGGRSSGGHVFHAVELIWRSMS